MGRERKGTASGTDRRKRLAAALKANIGRRKAQARATVQQSSQIRAAEACIAEPKEDAP
jgi:hypothetical protein